MHSTTSFKICSSTQSQVCPKCSPVGDAAFAWSSKFPVSHSNPVYHTERMLGRLCISFHQLSWIQRLVLLLHHHRFSLAAFCRSSSHSQLVRFQLAVFNLRLHFSSQTLNPCTLRAFNHSKTSLWRASKSPDLRPQLQLPN